MYLLPKTQYAQRIQTSIKITYFLFLSTIKNSETKSNTQTPGSRYPGRSNSNPYRKFFREPRYTSRSRSRSNSRPRNFGRQSPHNLLIILPLIITDLDMINFIENPSQQSITLNPPNHALIVITFFVQSIYTYKPTIN